MATYLLTIEPPDDLSNALSEIQETYRSIRWNRIIGPHITLVPRFESKSESRLIGDYLKQKIPPQSPFPIELTGINVFQHKHSVIYADVKPSTELSRLQSNVQSALSLYPESTVLQHETFHPHLTLSNKLTKEEVHPRFVAIQRDFTPTRFIVNAIKLYRLESNCWQLIKLIPFQT